MMTRGQKVIAPFDQATSVPYPIRTVLTSPDDVIEKSGRPLPTHDHHAIFRGDERYDDHNMRALRIRQQSMTKAEHRRYHDVHEECAIPDSSEKQVALLIWLLGGYVADTCVHVDKNLRVEELPLALADRQRYVESGLIRTNPQYQENVRKVLYPFIARNLQRSPAGSQISDALLDYTKPWYYTASSQLLSQACEVAMEPFAGDFAALYERGELPLARSGNIGEFVLGQLTRCPQNDVSKKEIRRLRLHIEEVAA